MSHEQERPVRKAGHSCKTERPLLAESGHSSQNRRLPRPGAAATHVHMLTELYIEALLADEALADEV